MNHYMFFLLCSVVLMYGAIRELDIYKLLWIVGCMMLGHALTCIWITVRKYLRGEA